MAHLTFHNNSEYYNMINREYPITNDEKSAILYTHYLEHGIIDFKKKKNGLPSMHDFANKVNYDRMMDYITEKNEKNIKKRERQDQAKCYKQDENDNTCPICYDEINDGKAILGCNHTFCLECYSRFHLKNNECPMCRTEFTEKKFQLMPEDYLDSTRSLVQEMKIFNDSAEPLKETQDFKELLNDTLRNMNYNNSFQTKKRIMKMTNHIMKIYGSCIRDFYEKQLFSS